MKWWLGICLWIWAYAVIAQSDYPKTSIKNNQIEAVIPLPHAKKGYYRGSRFDWAGQVESLKWKGREFFGQWFPRYDPYLHDAIMGPVDAFYPIDFDATPAGGSFVKIGIGILQKKENKPYHFAGEYPIQNPGKWKLKTKKNEVICRHRLLEGPFPYEYVKTLYLPEDKPELIIHHKLINRGTRPIETNVYNHNFFTIDQQITGPDFRVVFPFDLTASQAADPAIGGLDKNQIYFAKIFSANDHLYYGTLTGFGTDATDFKILVENKASGLGVEISSDRAIDRLVFWSAIKTICPEPYQNIQIPPSSAYEWTIRYRFYEIPKTGE
jgi:hypothetical protein